MKKIALCLVFLVCISFGKELTDDLKQVAKDGINSAWYKCNKVDKAFQKWDDSIQVICDNWTAIFIIKKYGGNWTIQVEK